MQYYKYCQQYIVSYWHILGQLLVMLIDYLSWQNLVANLLIAEIALLTDMAKQTIIFVKCCADWSVCLSVFLFIAFV